MAPNCLKLQGAELLHAIRTAGPCPVESVWKLKRRHNKWE